MKLSHPTQGKQITYYATVRDDFIHYLQKSYRQGDQYVTRNLKYMIEIDIYDEEKKWNISNNTSDKRKSI